MAEPKIVATQQAAQRSQSWLERLQSEGYRITASRQAVISTLAESHLALTPTDIYDLGRGLHSRLGLVTVYRTLEKLEELGLVQRVHRPDGCQAYLPSFDGHEHLLICESCGRVEVFKGDDLHEFSRRLEGESGFEIHDHWLQFFGLCTKCQ